MCIYFNCMLYRWTLIRAGQVDVLFRISHYSVCVPVGNHYSLFVTSKWYTRSANLRCYSHWSGLEGDNDSWGSRSQMKQALMWNNSSYASWIYESTMIVSVPDPKPIYMGQLYILFWGLEAKHGLSFDWVEGTVHIPNLISLSPLQVLITTSASLNQRIEAIYIIK